MSRTIRRKGAIHEYDWVLRKWTFTAHGMVEFIICRHSYDGRKRLAKFHSDAQDTMEMVPAWFRRNRNRLYRIENV